MISRNMAQSSKPSRVQMQFAWIRSLGTIFLTGYARQKATKTSSKYGQRIGISSGRRFPHSPGIKRSAKTGGGWPKCAKSFCFRWLERKGGEGGVDHPNSQVLRILTVFSGRSDPTFRILETSGRC
jgi:hypothetical protein